MNSIGGSVLSHLRTWSEGGETQCQKLLAPHFESLDERTGSLPLTIAFQTLLSSISASKLSESRLTSITFVNFAKSLVDALPSSSTSPAKQASALGFLLIDVLWSADADIDEHITTLKAAFKEKDKGNTEKVKGEGSKEKSSSTEGTMKVEVFERDRRTLADVLRGLVSIDMIEISTARKRLDVPLLVAAGLLAENGANNVPMDRREIRQRTTLIYKQNKVNLLREQAEGYTKLVTELSASMNAAAQTQDQDAPRTAWGRVVSLIGSFDLDPNRVLDIILDLFSANIKDHYVFFLNLLRCSHWAPLNDSKQADMDVDHSQPSFDGKSLPEALSIMETFSANTRPRPSSEVPAQVLGFKFVHYQNPGIEEDMPNTLYLTAALLVREGFITTEQLFPHISPTGEGMQAARERYLTRLKASFGASTSNALSSAAALPEETYSRSTTTRATTETAKPEASPKSARDPPNQFAGLASALLSLGALKPALEILSKHPWLPDAHHDIADILLRILSHSLDGLVEPDAPPEMVENRRRLFGQPRKLYRQRTTPLKERKITLVCPPPPSTQTTEFQFFYPSWADRIPICTKVEHLETLFEPLLNYVRLHLCRHVPMYTHLVRIGRMQLDKKNLPTSQVAFWKLMTRRYFFTALSCMDGSTPANVELWGLMTRFPLEVRWSMYAEWRAGLGKRNTQEIFLRAGQAEKTAKNLLRRLTGDNVDVLASGLAKLAHCNPLVLFRVALEQIMAYENLTTVAIRAFKFGAPLDRDVLLFMILEALAIPSGTGYGQKLRIKEDGHTPADWLSRLATFTGLFAKDYFVDLLPILRYMKHQLINNGLADLVVLKELILRMSDIEPIPDLADAQINGMAGGPLLRIEVIASATRGFMSRFKLPDEKDKDKAKKEREKDTNAHTREGAPKRLVKALQSPDFMLPLLIRTAQQRRECMYQGGIHPKALSDAYDTTTGIFLQFMEFLLVHMPLADFSHMIPSITSLHDVHGLPPSMTIELHRSIFSDAIRQRVLVLQKAEEKKVDEKESPEEREKRLKAQLAAKRASSPTASQRPSVPSTPMPDATSTYAPPNDGEDAPMSEPSSASMDKISSPWVPELEACFDEVRAILPSRASELLGPGFYLSFWQLSASDIIYPEDRYLQEDKRMTNEIDVVQKHEPSSKRYQMESYRKDLKAESSVQKFAQSKTFGRINREKLHWFANVESRPKQIVENILQHCVLPRAVISPMDADFCSRFIALMHTVGTPGFHTLYFYNSLFGDQLQALIFTFSTKEARHFGRFIFSVLKDLNNWHSSEKYYQNLNIASPKPGMRRQWPKEKATDAVTSSEILDWIMFKNMLKKWHMKLGASMAAAMESGDYLRICNAITVLSEILPVFPMASVHSATGPSLEKSLEKCLAGEKRNDVKALANAYSVRLNKTRAQWDPPRPQKVANGDSTVRRGTAATKPQHSSVGGTSKVESAVNGLASPAPTRALDKSLLESIPRPERVQRIDRAVSSEPRQANGTSAAVSSTAPSPAPPNASDASAPAAAKLNPTAPPFQPASSTPETSSRSQPVMQASRPSDPRGPHRPTRDEDVPGRNPDSRPLSRAVTPPLRRRSASPSRAGSRAVDGRSADQLHIERENARGRTPATGREPSRAGSDARRDDPEADRRRNLEREERDRDGRDRRRPSDRDADRHVERERHRLDRERHDRERERDSRRLEHSRDDNVDDAPPGKRRRVGDADEAVELTPKSRSRRGDSQRDQDRRQDRSRRTDRSRKERDGEAGGDAAGSGYGDKTRGDAPPTAPRAMATKDSTTPGLKSEPAPARENIGRGRRGTDSLDFPGIAGAGSSLKDRLGDASSGNPRNDPNGRRADGTDRRGADGQEGSQRRTRPTIDRGTYAVGEIRRHQQR